MQILTMKNRCLLKILEIFPKKTPKQSPVYDTMYELSILCRKWK